MDLEDSDDGDDSDGSDGMSYSSRQTTNTNYSYTNNQKQAITKPTNAKERFLQLVTKLSKIAEVIDKGSYFTKLSAAVVNVIMTAKPWIPREKFDKIYGGSTRGSHVRNGRKSMSKVRNAVVSIVCLFKKKRKDWAVK